MFTKTPSHWHRPPSPNCSFFCKKHTTPLLEKKGEWKHTSAGKRKQLTNPEKRVMLIEYIFSTTAGLKGEEVLVCWCTVRARGGEEDRRVQAEWESLTNTNYTETPKITLNISFKSAKTGKSYAKLRTRVILFTQRENVQLTTPLHLTSPNVHQWATVSPTGGSNERVSKI